MRLHEALMCVVALVSPLASLVLFPTWWAPLIAFCTISLPLVWLTGWLIDHTYDPAWKD
jgi:hypothetical protein